VYFLTAVKLFHEQLQRLTILRTAQQQSLVVAEWIYFNLTPDINHTQHTRMLLVCWVKAKIHYTSFSAASLQQVGDFPVTSPQHKGQASNKSVKVMGKRV